MSETISSAQPIDLYSEQHNKNPYPNFAWLRQNQPFYKTTDPYGAIFWVASRYEDVQAILKDSRFVKDYQNAWSPEKIAEFQERFNTREFRIINQNMLSSDPPDHTRLRGLISKAFTPRRVESLRPRIEQIADELLAAMDDQTEVDLLDSFAFPLPIRVIAELMGISVDDRDKFREWSNSLIDGTGPDPRPEVNRRAASQNFMRYLFALVEEKRKNPTDDLTSALIQVEEAGEKLSEDELIAMLWLLIIAGHETTVNLIANGTLALLQHPEQKTKLLQQPELIKNAVEEFLRFDGPVQTSTLRYAGQDVVVSGQLIQKGERVLVALGSSNRDGGNFARPDELDITRENNPHMAFGYGIHYCIGAPLARLEGQIGITKLLARFPNLRLAIPAEDLRWRPTLLLHSLQKMPVALG